MGRKQGRAIGPDGQPLSWREIGPYIDRESVFVPHSPEMAGWLKAHGYGKWGVSWQLFCDPITTGVLLEQELERATAEFDRLFPGMRVPHVIEARTNLMGEWRTKGRLLWDQS